MKKQKVKLNMKFAKKMGPKILHELEEGRLWGYLRNAISFAFYCSSWCLGTNLMVKFMSFGFLMICLINFYASSIRNKKETISLILKFMIWIWWPWSVQVYASMILRFITTSELFGLSGESSIFAVWPCMEMDVLEFLGFLSLSLFVL